MTKVTVPALGPAGAPAAQRNHFVTALDLFTFGITRCSRRYPTVGDHVVDEAPSDDYRTFAVDGHDAVVEMQTVHVPAGTFRALVVTLDAAQTGLPVRQRHTHLLVRAGSGLVKLVFAHRDGSVSTVVRLK